MLPVVTVFHAAFSPGAQLVFLLFRNILLPIGGYFVIRKHGSPLLLIIFMVFLLVSGSGEFVLNTKTFLKNFLYLISFIVFYRVGNFTPRLANPQSLGIGLITSSILVNLCVLAVYGLVLYGAIDVGDIYSVFEPERATGQGVGRFSIGNAIEVPFLSAAICYAATRILPVTKIVMIAVLLNLGLAFISESRLVILISSLILFSVMSNTKNKGFLLVTTLVLLCLCFIYIDEISIILVSVLDRFSGNDAGSTNDRSFIYSRVFNWMTESNVIFGEGLTTSLEKMRETTGIHRSVEAFALELLYELGLLGIVLLILVIVDGLPRSILITTLTNLPLLFIWIQLLFFLPLNPLTPMTGFCMGVATCKMRRKRENVTHTEKSHRHYI